jgi:hypothetical protein
VDHNAALAAGLPTDTAYTPLNPLRGAWLPVLGPELPLPLMVVALGLLVACCWRVTRGGTGHGLTRVTEGVLGDVPGDHRSVPVV